LNRIWITGAGGLIGNYLFQAASEFADPAVVTGLTRQMLDLTDFAAVRAAFRREPPTLIFHCAALTQSPACEADPALARRANVEATQFLADLASDVQFIFISTDLVFDGRAGNYDEAAPPAPLSVYGETKLAAERLVLQNPRHTVVRTSLNGGASPSGDRGFNEQLQALWRSGKSAKLFSDEFRSPICAAVTARALWELALSRQAGLFHIAGAERLSRLQIGEAVARRHPELCPRIEAGRLREYTGAPRAPDTSLDCRKVQRLLSFPLPGLNTWLASNPRVDF
jgi:dTDP-4-dehydrorhamnose reductase